jgi:DNA/RNA endonuclease G (NUC1)
MIRLFVILFVLVSQSLFAQAKRDSVLIETSVFTVMYSETLEQPLWIKYRSTNRPTNVNRGHMNFYKEKSILTSDDADYKANVYDKGHGAPAATFSDSEENLKQTFSYLNSIMQDQYLNRGIWRMLEEQERKWDDEEPLTVIIKTYFDKPIKRVPTGAAIPAHMEKHIYFEKSKEWRCYVFLNSKPKYMLSQLETICKPNQHKLK